MPEKEIPDGKTLVTSLERHYDKAERVTRGVDEVYLCSTDAVSRRVRQKVVRPANEEEIMQWPGSNKAVNAPANKSLGDHEREFNLDPDRNPKAYASSVAGAAGATTTTQEPMSSMSPRTGASDDTPPNNSLRHTHTEIATDVDRDAAIGTESRTVEGALSAGDAAPDADAKAKDDADAKVKAPPAPSKNPDVMNVEELNAYLDSVPDFDRSKVKGSGANDAVVRSDLVREAKKYARKSGGDGK